jgi:hypothetical protein
LPIHNVHPNDVIVKYDINANIPNLSFTHRGGVLPRASPAENRANASVFSSPKLGEFPAQEFPLLSVADPATMRRPLAL